MRLKLHKMVDQAITQALRAPDQAKDIFKALDGKLQDRGVTSPALVEIIDSFTQGGGRPSDAQIQRLMDEVREREETQTSQIIPTRTKRG
jgi:hypothetical protein